MDELQPFERQVAAEVVREMRPSRPVDAIAVIAAVGAAHPPSRRPWSMFGAAKLVVAGAIVALFGGLLLAGVLTQPTSDSQPAGLDTTSPDVSPSMSFRLPAVIPDDVESGTLDTPSGPARWVHLSGEWSTLPLLGQALPWPGGIAVFEPPEGVQEGRPARLWVSADGIDWQVEPLPFLGDAEPISLTFVDDVYWLHANSCGAGWIPPDLCAGGDRLWTSSDGWTWDEIGLDGLGPFEPSVFLDRLPAFAPPVTAGDLTLAVATSVGDFDDLSVMFHEHPGACDSGPLRSVGDGRYQLNCDQGMGPVMRFEETDTGLRVIDDGSGEALGEVPAADMTYIRWLSGEERGPMAEERWFAIQRLFRITDGTIAPIDVPWSQYDYTELFAIDDQMFAFVLDIEADNVADVTVYRCGDGRSWTDLGQAGFVGGDPEDLVGVGPSGITSVPGGIVLDYSVPQETADGTEWLAAPESPGDSQPYRTESGWFARHYVWPDGPDDWWVRVGETWLSLAELGMGRSSDWCVEGPHSVGTTTIFTAEGGGACLAGDGRSSFPTEMWILDLGPPG